MYFFCTLFDKNYSAKGLAMYKSLRRVCHSFHLFIFSFDDVLTYSLERMCLSDVTIIPLSSFEDTELLRVKSERSFAEYCWTCTPSTVIYCLNKYNIDHCIYLDADLFFFSNPKVLLDEMGDDDVLITEHRYTTQYDQSLISGKYCVQFMAFKNNNNSKAILYWWRNACLSWCYNRHEDGKFGDQKYLDDWTSRFTGIHVLKHLGGGVAPWNMQQYTFEKNGDRVIGRDLDGKCFEVVFFHFHALLSYKKGLLREFYAQEYFLSNNARNCLYVPYIKQLIRSFFSMRSIDKTIDGVATKDNPISSWWKYIKRLRKRFLSKETRYFYWIG